MQEGERDICLEGVMDAKLKSYIARRIIADAFTESPALAEPTPKTCGPRSGPLFCSEHVDLHAFFFFEAMPPIRSKTSFSPCKVSPSPRAVATQAI